MWLNEMPTALQVPPVLGGSCLLGTMTPLPLDRNRGGIPRDGVRGYRASIFYSCGSVSSSTSTSSSVFDVLTLARFEV